MAKESLNPPTSGARRICSDETESFDRGDFTGQIYVPKEAQLGFNALLITINGRHPEKRILEGMTRSYFVTKGTGLFNLDGALQEVMEGDLVVIPEGSEYEYAGDMTLFEFNVSPDNSFRDEKLE